MILLEWCLELRRMDLARFRDFFGGQFGGQFGDLFGDLFNTLRGLGQFLLLGNIKQIKILQHNHQVQI